MNQEGGEVDNKQAQNSTKMAIDKYGNEYVKGSKNQRKGRHSRIPIGPRTAAQIERQHKVWLDHCYGMTIQQIAIEHGISPFTVECDINSERAQRSEHDKLKKEEKIQKLTGILQDTIKMAKKSHLMYDDIANSGGKVTDHTLGEIINAVNSLTKLWGVDQASKVDINLRTILDAIEGDNGREEPLV